MKALIPSNEAERLKALRRYEILDTDPERDFRLQLPHHKSHGGRFFTQIASITVITLGSLVPTGWQLRIEAFKSTPATLACKVRELLDKSD